MSDARIPPKYVLFVGQRGGYKNFTRFFLSMINILDSDQEMKLLCIGGGSFTEKEKDQIKDYEKRVIQIDADDDVLEYAYSHAQCFVFPSLYEGFGIPTLEAFACDCPVILSDTSSMSEVGGKAVIYIDPYDCNDMEEKIRSVLYDISLREELIKHGREQLKKFDWDEIARQVVKCYEQVIRC